MMMKKSLFVVLALAFCLSACGSATPENEETFNNAVENFQTSEAAAEQTALPPVGDLTMNINAREDDTGYYVTGTWKNPDTGEIRWVLYRLDYPTGQQKILYDFGSYDSGDVFLSDPFVQKDAVYVEGNNSLYRLPLDGGEMEILPLDQTVGSSFSDENACYHLASNVYENDAQPTVQRVDLQTGAVTQWKLPAMYIMGVYDCSRNRVLIGRLITDQPMPSMEEEELFDIVMKAGTFEYDWLDLTTGELETVLTCPYSEHPDENGQTQYWSYRGMTGDSLYFRYSVIDGQGTQLSCSLERCALDGSGMETVMTLNTANMLYPVNRGTQLAWLLDYDYSEPATIYDVEQGKTYENIPIGESDSGWPYLLTNDGRVLLNDHHEVSKTTYAIQDTADYLAGSRNWTLFTEAEN